MTMNMKADYKKVSRARSKENGIVFYSNKNSRFCYETIIDDTGKIMSTQISSDMLDIEDFFWLQIPRRIEIIGIHLILKIIFLVLAITSFVVTKKYSISLALMFFGVTGLDKLIDLGGIIYEIKFGKSKSTGRFHSAEHMVTKAYEKCQRIPTMEEIRSESRFEKNCGSRQIIDKLLTRILIAMTIVFSEFVPIRVYIILIIADILIWFLENKVNFLRFLQILLTNKPTDKELSVALEGIKFFDKSEPNIKSDENAFPFRGIYVVIDQEEFEKQNQE